MPIHHRLIINSRRDIDVTCTCEKWGFSGTTVDRDTDESINERIREQYLLHIHHVIDHAPKDGFEVPAAPFLAPVVVNRLTAYKISFTVRKVRRFIVRFYRDIEAAKADAPVVVRSEPIWRAAKDFEIVPVESREELGKGLMANVCRESSLP